MYSKQTNMKIVFVISFNLSVEPFTIYEQLINNIDHLTLNIKLNKYNACYINYYGTWIKWNYMNHVML